MTTTSDPGDDDARTGFDRRTVLRGVAATGALGASATLLGGCGGGSDGGSAGGTGGSGGMGGSGGSGGMGGSGSSGMTLASTSEIPVGGGVVFKEQKIVVTQPSKGEFQGLSAICTHQGCPVAEVAGGTINCNCHGSKYNLDGSVANGPTTKPLPEKEIKVQGGDITLA